MKNLIKKENTIRYLKQKGIVAKKGFGQNFLIDEEVLSKIISGSGIGRDSIVLEIGPGMGTLTQALCENAGYVVAVEIDRDMIKYLDENLEGYDNYTIINEDILKVDLKKLYETITEEAKNHGVEPKDNTGFSVVANLPYYITTPIIMHLLESGVNITSITVMVQKEVADRMKARPGSKDCGALSLSVQYYADTEIIVNAPGDCFIPKPDVDSAVIKLSLKNDRRTVYSENREKALVLDENTERGFFELIKAAFTQRRKTFVNSVSSCMLKGLSKENVREMLIANGYDENIRGEKLSIYDYSKLSIYWSENYK